MLLVPSGLLRYELLGPPIDVTDVVHPTDFEQSVERANFGLWIRHHQNGWAHTARI